MYFYRVQLPKHYKPPVVPSQIVVCAKINGILNKSRIRQHRSADVIFLCISIELQCHASPFTISFSSHTFHSDIWYEHILHTYNKISLLRSYFWLNIYWFNRNEEKLSHRLYMCVHKSGVEVTLRIMFNWILLCIEIQYNRSHLCDFFCSIPFLDAELYV